MLHQQAQPNVLQCRIPCFSVMEPLFALAYSSCACAKKLALDVIPGASLNQTGATLRT